MISSVLPLEAVRRLRRLNICFYICLAVSIM